MRYIKDEKILLERVKSKIKKTYPIFKSEKKIQVTPEEVIQSVEFDPENGEDGFRPSYWVYLNPGFITEGGYGCHTIHEDTLKNIKEELDRVVYDPEDKE